jgi:glycosyltransferase involved in cell wall biosynthesis
MKGCSVIVPCFNEKESVIETLKSIIKAVLSQAYEFEVIIVNDASTDGSRELLEKSGLPVRIINNAYRLGYGASLKKGIRESKYEFICIIDCDNTYPAEMIPELIKDTMTNNYDMVVGARIKKKNKIPLIRKPAKWFLSKFANYLAERDIPDLNSGLRVMRKALLEKYINILPNGFSFTTTITMAMLTDNYSVNYIPIDYYQRKGRSKVRPIRDTFNFILLIMRTALYFNPLKIFIPAAAIFLLFAFTIFFYSYFSLGKTMDATVTILVVSTFQMLFLGMIADLINRRSR